MTTVLANPEHIHRVSLRDKEFRLVLPDSSTDSIQKHIAHTGHVYEPDLVEDVLDRCPAGSLIIDVGANIGNHTIAWACAGGHSVMAYEPNPRLAELIRHSAVLNHVEDGVHVVQRAVGDSESMSRLVVSDPSNLGGGRLVDSQEPVSSEHGNDVPECYEVKVAPLDHQGGPVGVIKVDVEGFEVEVLRGATDLIAEHHPLLYVECLDFQHFSEILELVSELGYAYEETFNASPTHRFGWTGTVPAPVQPAVLHLARRMYSDHAAYLSTRQSLLSANQKYRAAGTTVDNLKERIRLLEATASAQGTSPADLSLHGQLADALQLIRRLEAELLQTKLQSSDWSQALAERDLTVQRLSREHADLSSSNRALRAEVEELRAVTDLVTTERDTLAERKERLQKDADQTNESLGRALQELNDRNHELAALRDESVALATDLQELKRASDGWHSAQQRLESRYFDELTRLEYTEDQLALTRVRLDEERERAEELQQRTERLQAELNRLSAELAKDDLRRTHHQKDLETLRAWVAARQEAEDDLGSRLEEASAAAAEHGARAEKAEEALLSARTELETLREESASHSSAAAHFKAEAAGLHDAIRQERRTTQTARLDWEQATQELARAAEENDRLREELEGCRQQGAEAAAALERLRHSKTYLAGVEVRNSRSLPRLLTLPSRLARVARIDDVNDQTKELPR